MIKKLKSGYAVRYEISGAGVLHVRSSEVLKTKQAQRQIDAVSKMTLSPKQKTAIAQ